MFSSIKREFKYLSGVLRTLKSIKSVDSKSDNLVVDDLEAVVDKFGSNLAFIEDDKTLTYQDMEIFANRVAGWCSAQGLKRGDTVAVFVRNRAEYVPLWFGLAKCGIIPALLNFQLQAKALAHCLSISDAKVLILDHEMSESWTLTKKDAPKDLKVYAAFGPVKGLPRLEDELSTIEPHRPPKSEREGIVAGDMVMKMFTSGTTGLPKAAKVTHVRAQNYLRGFAAAAKVTPKDRMMMVLPMYHATGGLCGVGAAIMRGGAVIVRPKFSATKFWDEAVKFEATLLMYVGELCRFLLSSPPHEKERAHKIRCIIGNGLRKDVWDGFVARFNIPNVIEFYGATEGNVSLINIGGRSGACGRIPSYVKSRFNAEIIRYDVETGVNVRGSDGFCQRVNPGEVGELLGEIRSDDPRYRFDGYGNAEANSKKVLSDVFVKGDKWFRTGDLLSQDEDGYFYFADRIGDTYRWKAENVATGEVAGVMSMFEGITQANVYGVEVQGHDGRAGMAAIVCENEIDLAALKSHIEVNLPAYARPVFLRISPESETTSTFKFKKTNLVKAGFNPKNVTDPLYVASPETGAYEPIDAAMFKRIISGDLRL